MKIEYDIHLFNPDISNDLNNRDSSRDVSFTPLIKDNSQEKPSKFIIEKEELTKKYKKLQEIIQDDNLKNFIIQCLFIDFLTILLFTYELLDSFLEINDFFPSGILYLFRYSVSLINCILFLDFLIVQDEHINHQKQLNYENINKKKDKKQISSNYEGPIYIILTGPNKVLRLIYRTKIFIWFFKYTIYLIFILIKEKISFSYYISTFLFLIEHYQYNFCKFFYYTMLRAEFYKKKIELLESSV